MSGDELFALLFLLSAFAGLLIATWTAYGGEEILGEKLVNFIESRIDKKKTSETWCPFYLCRKRVNSRHPPNQ